MTKLTMRNGTEIEICAVSSYLISNIRQKAREDYEAEHGPIEIPTYEVTMGGGPDLPSWTETFPHTEETIESAPDDVRQAWNEYLEAERGLFGLVWLRTSRAHLLRGVVTDPPSDGWVERQTKDGAKIPDDPDDLKIHWIETELVVNPHELGQLVATIQAQSNATEAARQAAADMFRCTMEQA